MHSEYFVSKRLIEKAKKEESVQIVESRDGEGTVLIIVATGATAGLLKSRWFNQVFPEYAIKRKARDE